jgi:hypothetical protein
VVDQFLAECFALVGVLDALLVTHAGEADGLDDNADALVVEVCHDDFEALVLFADEVLNWHFDVFEGDVGSTARPDTLAVHAAGADAAEAAFDEQDGDAVHAFVGGADCSSEVVGPECISDCTEDERRSIDLPDTVGDPLLLAVDDVVLAILAQLGLAGKICNIRAGIRLGDGQADALVTTENVGKDTVFESLLSVLVDRWATNTKSTEDVPDETTRARTRQLICDQELVEQIPLLCRDTGGSVLDEMCRVWVDSEETREPSTLSHGLVHAVWNLLRFVPLGDVRHDLVLHPLTDLGAEVCMSLVEVWGVVAVVPRWVRIWDHVAERVHGLRFFVCCRTRHGHDNARLCLGDDLLFLFRGRSGRWCGRSSGLGLRVERTDLQLLLVLLQDGLVVVLPKLLASVFAGNTLED